MGKPLFLLLRSIMLYVWVAIPFPQSLGYSIPRLRHATSWSGEREDVNSTSSHTWRIARLATHQFCSVFCHCFVPPFEFATARSYVVLEKPSSLRHCFLPVPNIYPYLDSTMASPCRFYPGSLLMDTANQKASLQFKLKETPESTRRIAEKFLASKKSSPWKMLVRSLYCF